MKIWKVGGENAPIYKLVLPSIIQTSYEWEWWSKWWPKSCLFFIFPLAFIKMSTISRIWAYFSIWRIYWLHPNDVCDSNSVPEIIMKKFFQWRSHLVPSYVNFGNIPPVIPWEGKMSCFGKCKAIWNDKAAHHVCQNDNKFESKSSHHHHISLASIFGPFTWTRKPVWRL